MGYTATARREGKFWVITVDGVGVTQALSVAEAPEMAAGLVYAMTDVKDAEVEINFEGVDVNEIAAVRHRQEQADCAVAEASEAMRALVAGMDQQGLKQSDIATLLNVSRQRASQLVRESAGISSG